MSGASESTIDQPSKTARKNALRLVNQADELVARLLPPGQWDPDPKEKKAFVASEAFERFLRLYFQAMELDAVEPAYPWNLASALRRLDKADLALGLMGRALKVAEQLQDPEWFNADAFFVWAETAIAAGQDELALSAIARAAEHASDDEHAHDHALRLLRALAESRKRRYAHLPADPVHLVLLIDSGTAAAEDSSDDFAKRTMRALGDSLKKLETARGRSKGSA